VSTGRPVGRDAVAVLTGDLVGSTGLLVRDLERARSVVIEAVAEMARWPDGGILAGAEFFRGDSWQVLLGEPRHFLRAALYVRASLRREGRDLDTRIGVGIGAVEKIDLNRVSLSIGEAFTASGRALDGMSGDLGVTVSIPDHASEALGWIRPMAALCSAATNHWSERQAEIVSRMLTLPGPRQMDVAAMLAVSRQQVSKSLAAVDFDAVLAAISYVEHIDWSKALQPRRQRRLI